MIIKKTFMILVLACLFSSCTLNDNEIKQEKWKYVEGSELHYDVLVFGGGVFKLSGDTIFFLNSAIATVIDTKKNYFLRADEITLKNLKTGETVIYCDFAKIKAEDTIVTIELKQIDLGPPPPIPPIPPLPEDQN
jgi:hypothetical protein